MHIQEGTNTTLTTCTKMTEEVDRRHGVNGNSGGKGATDESACSNAAPPGSGGRLKFFKDGKFILELVRGAAREGERAGWVSVPRKTFWPPAAAAAPAAHTAQLPRPERAASLSVSDDNSSIQSSPWQRDHCWKQTSPRRNISKELTMYYCRPSTLLNGHIDASSRRKRRRPYDVLLHETVNGKELTNGVCDKKRNGEAEPADGRGDCVDGPMAGAADDGQRWSRWTDVDRTKYYHMKLKKPYQYHKCRVYKKTKPPIKRKLLNGTVEKLRSRVAAMPVGAAGVHAKLASCRQEHAMVSPRKRILRELERVSLEEQGSKRRAKTVPALSTASYPPSPGPSHHHHKPLESPSRSHNGAPSPRNHTPVSKNVSSYSIHSLLSMPDESPTRRSPEPKRSPHSALKTESPSSVTSPDLSPSPDGYRYRYNALLGSPGQGQGQGPAPRDSPTPPYRYAAATSPYGSGRARLSPHTHGAHTHAHAHAQAHGYSAQYRDPPYVSYAPYAAGAYLPPHVYRAPAPLYYYAMSPALPALPPGPWAPLAHPLLTDHIPKDEPTSDVPLNLSKH